MTLPVAVGLFLAGVSLTSGEPAHPRHRPHVVFDPNRTLTPEEAKWIEENEQFHRQHAGHEAMHAEMMLVLLLTILFSQIALYLWKRFHPSSFKKVTLFGMWVIPVYFSLRQAFVRMLVIWAMFTVCTAVVIYSATRHPLPRTTPRKVYYYFFGIYKASYLFACFGYALAVLAFLGLWQLMHAMLSQLPTEDELANMGLLCMFYGLYYGVLSRDLAEICSGRMASSIGFYTEDKEHLPKKQLDATICAICGDQLAPTDDVENRYTFSCQHAFHEFCIRGWTIVGKKQTCPYCNEKVDLKKMFPTIWARQDIMFSQLLDVLRYLVVWQPVIFMLAKFINFELGLK